MRAQYRAPGGETGTKEVKNGDVEVHDLVTRLQD